MSGHLTRQRSSWRNWVLSKLGLTDLPTPVNCWYCNQTMYLLPGSKQTERHWHCNLCENDNVIDEFGDIMDAPPLPDTAFRYGYGLSQEQQKANKQPGSISSESSNPRTLCNSCQSNQTLIYQIMSDYIRDESDPDYDYYVRTADSYQQSLHAKYPLCDDCRRKIRDIEAEQRNLSRRRRINEQRQRSLHTKTPTRLTSNQYLAQGLLWLLLHCSVMFLCSFVIFYPPQPLNHSTVITPVKNRLLCASNYIFSLVTRKEEQHTTILSLSTPSTLMHGACYTLSPEKILTFIANESRATIYFLFYASYKLIIRGEGYMDDTNQEESQDFWDVTSIGITFYVLFYTISFYFMNWHFRASRTFLGITKPRFWSAYKAIQGFLYVGRLAFLYSLGFMTFTNNITIWKSFSCVYFMLVLSSVYFVQVKKSTKSSRWWKKFVHGDGHNHHLQQQQQPDSALNRQFLQPPSATSSSTATSGTIDYSTPLGSTESNKSWYIPPLKFLSRQHCDNEDEVDGLTSELGKISV